MKLIPHLYVAGEAAILAKQVETLTKDKAELKVAGM